MEDFWPNIQNKLKNGLLLSSHPREVTQLTLNMCNWTIFSILVLMSHNYVSLLVHVPHQTS